MFVPERQLDFFSFFLSFLFNCTTRHLKKQLLSVRVSCPYDKSPKRVVFFFFYKLF